MILQIHCLDLNFIGTNSQLIIAMSLSSRLLASFMSKTAGAGTVSGKQHNILQTCSQLHARTIVAAKNVSIYDNSGFNLFLNVAINRRINW